MMLQDAYSPDTGEHIPTDNPAAWMLRAGIAAPAYDPSTSGCFWRNGAWVIVSALPQILIDAQAAKNANINAQRDIACVANAAASIGGVAHLWQADQRSTAMLGQAISLAQAGLPLPTVWRSYDNVDVPISALADLLAIAGAIAVQVQTAYAHSWTLKAQVAAATTVAEVEAIASW